MSVGEVVILAGALTVTGLMGWYFFGPKKSRQAELADGVQIIRVTVKGGYSPNVIRVTAGVPVRMLFERQESGDCSSRVVIPAFHVNQLLPAYSTTPVEFLPQEAGEYEFACGMNMIRGRLQVVGDGVVGSDASATTMQDHAGTTILMPAGQSAGDHASGHSVVADAGAGEDPSAGEEGERRLEIADLTRRVIFGAARPKTFPHTRQRQERL